MKGSASRSAWPGSSAAKEAIRTAAPTSIVCGKKLLLQQHIAEIPRAGDSIQGTGGLRKIRWKANDDAGFCEQSGTREAALELLEAMQRRIPHGRLTQAGV